MLATERGSIYRPRGINNASSSSRVKPLDYRPVLDLLRQAARHPATTALLATGIVATAAAIEGIKFDAFMPPSTSSTRQTLILPEAQIEEPIPETAQMLLLDPELEKFIHRLPRTTSISLTVFTTKDVKGFVQPEEGLNVRELPTQNSKKVAPYGYGKMQEVNFSARLTFETPQSDGTTRHESWAALRNGGYVLITRYNYDTQGIIIPSSMELPLATVEPATSVSYTLSARQ